jgi:quercetin dioxygenase-like cupin family protein
MLPTYLQTLSLLEEGKPKEIEVLLADPYRKVVRVILRHKEVFDDHSTKVPLLIFCLQGTGTLRVGSEEIPLTPGVLVPLDAGVIHAVEAEPAVALLLTLFRGTPTNEPTP